MGGDFFNAILSCDKCPVCGIDINNELRQGWDDAKRCFFTVKCPGCGKKVDVSVETVITFKTEKTKEKTEVSRSKNKRGV